MLPKTVYFCAILSSICFSGCDQHAPESSTIKVGRDESITVALSAQTALIVGNEGKTEQIVVLQDKKVTLTLSIKDGIISALQERDSKDGKIMLVLGDGEFLLPVYKVTTEPNGHRVVESFLGGNWQKR